MVHVADQDGIQLFPSAHYQTVTFHLNRLEHGIAYVEGLPEELWSVIAVQVHDAAVVIVVEYGLHMAPVEHGVRIGEEHVQGVEQVGNAIVVQVRHIPETHHKAQLSGADRIRRAVPHAVVL